jgi:hypothetical protein
MSSDRISEITLGVVDLLKSNWEELGLPGPEDVYYGDQSRYPRTPSVAVQINTLIRELNQTGIQTLNEIGLFVLIYHSPYANMEVSQKETDLFAEGIETLLHNNRTINGLLIHSHVSNHEPGVSERGGTILRTTRLTLTGVSKTMVAR